MNFEDATTRVLEKLVSVGDEGIDQDDLRKVNIGHNKFGEVLGYLLHKNAIIQYTSPEKMQRIRASA